MKSKSETITGVAAFLPHRSLVLSLLKPYRHCDLIPLTQAMNRKWGSFTQGFITSENRIVDRHEAWHIAEAANQILPDEDKRRTGTLYSEDIW